MAVVIVICRIRPPFAFARSDIMLQNHLLNIGQNGDGIYPQVTGVSQFCMGHGVFPYRTFNVASPMIANISEIIQKRMTICGSVQPFFS